jgi:hypothetical protein
MSLVLHAMAVGAKNKSSCIRINDKKHHIWGIITTFILIHMNTTFEAGL